jgi:hypothetical protein
MLHKLPVISLAGSPLYPQAQVEVMGGKTHFHRTLFSAKRDIRRLVDADFERREIGAANRVRAILNFSPELVAESVLRVYRKVI